jgi:hypothetical protein
MFRNNVYDRIASEGRPHGWQSLVFAAGLLATGISLAGPVDGTWKLASSGEYFGDASLIVPLPEQRVQVSDGNLVLSASCTARLTAEPYAYSTVFQGLLRENVRADRLNKYVVDKFAFNFDDVRAGYKVEKSACTHGLQEVFVNGDRMLVVASNTIFYAFNRVGSFAKFASSSTGIKQKISPLPFNVDSFDANCAAVIPRARGIPQTTLKCAPAFYPYVASKDDQDMVANLFGHHRYVKKNTKYYDDYNEPVLNGFHPIYMVLPPMKDLIVVRVEDREGNAEDRDFFGGAYLSIKDGTVIDQLDGACTFMPDYSCVNEHGIPAYRLADTGKFVKY